MQKRCPTLTGLTPALRPGNLNKMFEDIVDKAPGNRSLTDQERQALKDKNMTEYSVVVHSRPSDSPSTEISQVQDTSLPPWVITFENFITPEECEALIQLGYKHGYKQSEVCDIHRRHQGVDLSSLFIPKELVSAVS
jgi:prolyl 4-hydroxylase